jgi:hypothetical protein
VSLVTSFLALLPARRLPEPWATRVEARTYENVRVAADAAIEAVSEGGARSDAAARLRRLERRGRSRIRPGSYWNDAWSTICEWLTALAGGLDPADGSAPTLAEINRLAEATNATLRLTVAKARQIDPANDIGQPHNG